MVPRPRRAGADLELRAVPPQTPLHAKTPDGDASVRRLPAGKATGARANPFGSRRRSCGIGRTNRRVPTVHPEDTRRRAMAARLLVRRGRHPAIQLQGQAAARTIRPRPAILAVAATVAVAADITADELRLRGCSRCERSGLRERAARKGSEVFRVCSARKLGGYV